ncbi:glycosyltransferase [Streptomyces phage Kela]|nr:glycosyltransferase [Streptomyces phage Kela]
MKHTVLVPAWRRPDMLHACLTRLSKAVTDDVHVIVSLDRKGTLECRQVAESFSTAFADIYLRVMHHHQFHGNSYNVLSGLGDALKVGGDLIHVVEDDIMVSLGYFAFHEEAHLAAPDAFAVSACKNQNLQGEPPAAAYRHPSYQSLGVSMRPENVEKAVVHNKPVYYGDMVNYCKRNFPGSLIPPGHAEQDGLINRVRERERGVTVYPAQPRAFHAGFYGYNRTGTKLGGSIERRSAKILSMTSEEMNAMAGLMKDHEVIDLEENLPAGPVREALAS